MIVPITTSWLANVHGQDIFVVVHYLVPHQQDPRVVVLLYDLLVLGQLAEVDDEDDDDEDVDNGDSDNDDDDNNDNDDDDDNDDEDDDEMMDLKSSR